MPKRRSGCFFFEFFFCVANFPKKEIRFFQTKQKVKKQIFSQTFETFFKNKNNNVKDDERTIFEIFQKKKKNKNYFRETVLVILEEKIFVQRRTKEESTHNESEHQEGT